MRDLLHGCFAWDRLNVFRDEVALLMRQGQEDDYYRELGKINGMGKSWSM